MDKSALLDRMGGNREDRLLLAKILDRAAQSQNHNTFAATDFLTPQQQSVVSALLRLAEIAENCYIMTGGYDGAERKICLFLPGWADGESVEPPLHFIRAEFRPEAKLTHRDILGSLMGLGIAREKIGDILLTDAGADVVTAESVSGFLIQNWSTAGRETLHIVPIDAAQMHFPEVKFQEIRDTVSSLRLDAVLTKATALIAAGRVQVNWKECLKADKPLVAQDVITVRGYGKMELAAVNGLTRKGRLSITIKRFL